MHHHVRNTTRPLYKPPKKLAIPLWTLQAILTILVILQHTIPFFTHIPEPVPKRTRDRIQGTQVYYTAGSAVTLVLSALDILLYALGTQRYRPVVALVISVLQFCIVLALSVAGLVQFVSSSLTRLPAIHTTFNTLIILVFLFSLLTKSIYYHRYRGLFLFHSHSHSHQQHQKRQKHLPLHPSTRPRITEKPADGQRIFDKEFADFLCNPHALNRHLLEKSPNCNVEVGGHCLIGGIGGTNSRASSPATTWWRAEMEGEAAGDLSREGCGDSGHPRVYYSSRRYSRNSGCSTIQELDGEDVKELEVEGSERMVVPAGMAL